MAMVLLFAVLAAALGLVFYTCCTDPSDKKKH